MKEIEVVAGIIKYNNKILCTQRDVSKNEEVSFKWEFPGGKIEEGETKEQALKREIKEELNLDILIKDEFYVVNYTYPNFKLKMYCFNCESKTDKVSLNVHKSFKWLNYHNLKSLDWAPADIELIEKIVNGKNL